MSVTANGLEIALYNVDGKFYATDNTCVIRAARWAKACWRAKWSVAPGTCGNTTSAPAKSGQLFRQAGDVSR